MNKKHAAKVARMQPYAATVPMRWAQIRGGGWCVRDVRDDMCVMQICEIFRRSSLSDTVFSILTREAKSHLLFFFSSEAFFFVRLVLTFRDREARRFDSFPPAPRVK